MKPVVYVVHVVYVVYVVQVFMGLWPTLAMICFKMGNLEAVNEWERGNEKEWEVSENEGEGKGA